MENISRRKFFYIVAALSFSHPLYVVAASSKENKPVKIEHFPITYAVLKAAYKSEKVASEHYVGYARIAVEEKYPNIAYLFSAFAVSEKIHAAIKKWQDRLNPGLCYSSILQNPVFIYFYNPLSPGGKHPGHRRQIGAH